VWDETLLIMLDLFDDVWGDKKEIITEHCVDITLQVWPYYAVVVLSGADGLQDCTFGDKCCRYRYWIAICAHPGVYFSNIGFGQKISWLDDQTIPNGHRMTFKQALHIVSTDLILRAVVPGWAMGLTQRLRNIHIASEELEVGMTTLVLCQIIDLSS
jgi:hypothetical protein